MDGERRKLKKLLRLIVGGLGICSGVRNGQSPDERERLRRLRGSAEVLAARVRDFAGAVEEMAAGPEPGPGVVCDLEPVLAHLADALSGVCAGLTFGDRQLFFSAATKLWDEALRSNEESAGEGGGS